ncbi:ADP-ribosylglycohydrolase family protein [Thermovibrio sp.]
MFKDRVRGAVFGAIIGDALGSLVEEMDRETVRREYGGPIVGFVEPSPNSVCYFLKKGQYSHESQVFLMALSVYAEKGYFDENLYVEKLTEWVKDEKSHRYPSGAHLNAALSLSAGLEVEEARVKASDVDGAIPAAAAGLYRWDSTQEAYEEGAYIASITHDDETLRDTAGLLAASVSLAVGRRVELATIEGKLHFLEILREMSRSENVKAYLDLTLQLEKKGNFNLEEATLTLGNGSFAPEAFSLALYLFLSYPDSFRKALLNAVNSYGEFGGDTDAVAFITGCLSGGYNGTSQIPESWLKCVESKEEIERIIDKFLSKLGI